MRVVTGSGGELFVRSDPVPVIHAPLVSGDGFDWRAADPVVWSAAQPLLFEAWDGDGWRMLEPLRVQHQSARVEFPRCLRDAHVRVSGLISPLARTAVASVWRLTVEVLTHERGGFGDVQYEQTVHGAAAELTGWEATGTSPEQPHVFCRLPFAAGAFVGDGLLNAETLVLLAKGRADTAPLKVVFEKGAVDYVLV